MLFDLMKTGMCFNNNRLGFLMVFIYIQHNSVLNVSKITVITKITIWNIDLKRVTRPNYTAYFMIVLNIVLILS